MGNTILNVGELREKSGKKSPSQKPSSRSPSAGEGICITGFWDGLPSLENEFRLKNIPQSQLHLPPGWQIRTCLEGARQGRIELIGRVIAIICY